MTAAGEVPLSPRVQPVLSPPLPLPPLLPLPSATNVCTPAPACHAVLNPPLLWSRPSCFTMSTEMNVTKMDVAKEVLKVGWRIGGGGGARCLHGRACPGHSFLADIRQMVHHQPFEALHRWCMLVEP